MVYIQKGEYEKEESMKRKKDRKAVIMLRYCAVSKQASRGKREGIINKCASRQ